jgi:hypothetical protein
MLCGLIFSPLAALASQDWETKIEAKVEDRLEVSERDAYKAEDATGVVSITIAGNGHVLDYSIEQPTGSKFLDARTKSSLAALRSLPAFSSDANEKRTMIVKVTYDKIRVRSDRQLREKFEREHGYRPSAKEWIVEVDARVIDS